MVVVVVVVVGVNVFVGCGFDGEIFGGGRVVCVVDCFVFVMEFLM